MDVLKGHVNRLMNGLEEVERQKERMVSIIRTTKDKTEQLDLMVDLQQLKDHEHDLIESLRSKLERLVKLENERLIKINRDDSKNPLAVDIKKKEGGKGRVPSVLKPWLNELEAVKRMNRNLSHKQAMIVASGLRKKKK